MAHLLHNLGRRGATHYHHYDSQRKANKNCLAMVSWELSLVREEKLITVGVPLPILGQCITQ